MTMVCINTFHRLALEPNSQTYKKTSRKVIYSICPGDTELAAIPSFLNLMGGSNPVEVQRSTISIWMDRCFVRVILSGQWAEAKLGSVSGNGGLERRGKVDVRHAWLIRVLVRHVMGKKPKIAAQAF
jgi:hypothetical protein